MLLVIDNYDSFTYNLVQYLGELGAKMKVIRNDEMTVDEIETEVNPEKILISPGPGTPDDAGVSLSAIERPFLLARTARCPSGTLRPRSYTNRIFRLLTHHACMTPVTQHDFSNRGKHL